MPTYQYKCTECAEPLEAQQSFSDASLTECPACGGHLRKVFNAVGVVFKGSGFYRNDSRDADAASANGSGSKSESTSDSGSKSDSGAKSDSGSKSDSGAKSDSGSKSDSSNGSSGSSSGSKSDTSKTTAPA